MLIRINQTLSIAKMDYTEDNVYIAQHIRIDTMSFLDINYRLDLHDVKIINNCERVFKEKYIFTLSANTLR